MLEVGSTGERRVPGGAPVLEAVGGREVSSGSGDGFGECGGRCVWRCEGDRVINHAKTCSISSVALLRLPELDTEFLLYLPNLLSITIMLSSFG